MSSFIKNLARFGAQQTLGRLPQSAARLDGPLKTEGGKPVRDVRLRPWPKVTHQNRGLIPRILTFRSHLWNVWLSGTEGLPQPLAKEFSSRWAEYCGCKFALLLPHGTDALRLGLAAAFDHDGLGYGGEVIVPNVSFIASATAALDRRFGVCFVDVEPDTLLLDPKRVEEAIVPGKTKAIMAVHLFGQPADMTALRDIAMRHKLRLIEDAAQAHGASWENKPAGSLGDVAGFSFQAFKNLNCGEGGAMTTNEEEIFERAYRLNDAGRRRVGGDRWSHDVLGWNCRPTEYQAALLLDRFAGLDGLQEIRRKNAAALRGMLADVPCVEPLVTRPGATKHGVNMFVMRYKKERCGGLSVDDFLHVCGAEGAPIYRGYSTTMANQPAMQTVAQKHPDYVRTAATPVSDAAVQEIIYISQNIFLGRERDMTDIAAALRKIFKHHGSRA